MKVLLKLFKAYKLSAGKISQTWRHVLATMHLSKYLDAITRLLLNENYPHQGISI